MSDWTISDLLPGLYVFLLGAGLAAILRRFYDAVPWRILAVFGVVLILLFGTVLFGGGVLLPLGNLAGFAPFRQLPLPDPPTLALQGDLVHQITPWTLEVRRAFAEGHWPLWNVRAGAGMPLLGDPQTQVLQPLVMLAYPFPITAAVGITAALRVLFALIFSFLLLRRLGLGEAAALGGSLAFGLGGFLILWLGWPMANCAAWLPVVLYGIARCERASDKSPACPSKPHPRPLSRGERGDLAGAGEAVGCDVRTVNVDGAHSTPYKALQVRLSHPSPPGRGAGGEASKGKRLDSAPTFQTPSDLLLLFLATLGLMLAGHPEVMLYALGFAGLFLIDRVRRLGGIPGRRLLFQCGLTMALAGATASPLLLPAIEYLPQTERAAIVAATMPPISLSELWRDLQRPEIRELWRKRALERLLPIVAPRAYGDHNYYWGDGNVIDSGGGFVGSAALLAAFVALFPRRGRRRFPLEGLALLVLIVALLLVAQPSGLDRLMVRVPILGATFIHQTHRILILISFCLAVLAVCEAQRRWRGEGSRWPVVVGAAVLAALILWGYQAHPNPQDPSLLADFRNRMLTAHLVALALATALLLLKLPGRWGRAVPWLFCGLVAGELLLVHGPALPPAPRRLAYPVTPPMRFLQENLGDFRVVGMGKDVLPANFALVYGLNDVRIDNPSLPEDYAATTWPLRREPPHLFARPRHPLYDLLGVRYVLAEPGANLPLRLVLQDPALWIYARPGALPRLFLPERAVVYRGGPWGDWLEANRDFAKRSLVASIPGGAADWRALSPRESTLDVSLPEPERVHARAHLAEPRLLASSVLQDGHWHVLVDGKPHPALLADGILAGAWLPAGEHRVDLLYRPGLFLLGLGLAALGLTTAVVWWVPKPGEPSSPRPSSPSLPPFRREKREGFV